MKAKSITMLFSIFMLLTILPGEVFARAGGGGGGGGKVMGILAIILIPIAIIVGIMISYYLNKRSKEASNLSRKIEKYDKSWNLQKMEKDVKETYFKIQEAWMERNQDIALDYMSESLYSLHKTQTDLMIKENRKNILNNIQLNKVKIVEIEDYKKDSIDHFWAYISGSMIDYIADDVTGNLISGDSHETQTFAEVWKFVRGPENRWVLDCIEQDILGNLMHFRSFSEELEEPFYGGYLVCKNCGGYYQLQKEEDPEDFDTCMCGGHLSYHKDNESFKNNYSSDLPMRNAYKSKNN
jgi:uncharacterized membrane-anchored protein YhcB (DUF1043 family)